ncbi:MAG: DinB family protein [Chloroflexi bacterium]|nr:DinB family protein [Chloroflexota bacterium]
MTFLDSLARCATWTDPDLAKAWTYRERTTNLRYALYRSVEEEQEAVVAALGAPQNEATRIISLAQAAFGDLRGLLAGVPEAFLDRTPAEGEWSLRATLHHVLAAERTYRAQTRYAVERAESDPTLFPPERRPETAPAEVAGTVAAIVALFERERAETDRFVRTMSDSSLGRLTVYAGFTVDSRFRLHRFAAHFTEHTIQCETTIERLGLAQADAPRIVRELSRMRGLHERTTDPTVLATQDATLAARAALA